MNAQSIDQLLSEMLDGHRIVQWDYDRLRQLLAQERAEGWTAEIVENRSVKLRATVPKASRMYVVAKAFDVAEVRAHILSFLPWKSLVAARKVCQAFRRTIDDHPPLRVLTFQREPAQPCALQLLPYRTLCCNLATSQAHGQSRLTMRFSPGWFSSRAKAGLSGAFFPRRLLLAQPSPKSFRVEHDCNCGQRARQPVTRPADGKVCLGPVTDAVEAVGLRCDGCGTARDVVVRFNL